MESSSPISSSSSSSGLALFSGSGSATGTMPNSQTVVYFQRNYEPGAQLAYKQRQTEKLIDKLDGKLIENCVKVNLFDLIFSRTSFISGVLLFGSVILLKDDKDNLVVSCFIAAISFVALTLLGFYKNFYIGEVKTLKKGINQAENYGFSPSPAIQSKVE